MHTPTGVPKEGDTVAITIQMAMLISNNEAAGTDPPRTKAYKGTTIQAMATHHTPVAAAHHVAVVPIDSSISPMNIVMGTPWNGLTVTTTMR